MHTAFGLKQEMFEISINGVRATRDRLFTAHRHERIGVVVTSSLGALGASFLVQLGITAYYDAPDTTRHSSPHYPELYFFHVGGAYGEYSLMDAWPSRKQVYLPDDGPATLEAINSHAITHLILPDEPNRNDLHGFVEPNAALDRLEGCFLYDPSGRTHDADLAIRAVDRRALRDIFHTINLREAMTTLVASFPVPDDPVERQDNEVWIAQANRHLDDTTEEDRRIAERRRLMLDEPSGTLETYRRISGAEAVRKLGRILPE